MIKAATNAIVKDIVKIKNSNNYLVELSLDYGGLPTSNLLVDIITKEEYKIAYRVLYAAMKDLHKRFAFEKVKIIPIQIMENDLKKIKLELLEKEQQNIFQFIITPTQPNSKPYVNQEFICINLSSI